MTGKSEDGLSPAIDEGSSSSNQKCAGPPESGKKGSCGDHGNKFQSKLLILYALRAIKLKYKFYLGTELSVGEKFDDLIFHYKDENDTSTSSKDVTKATIRQQYMQAKHRLNEQVSITADQLINKNNNESQETKKSNTDTGDFSLLKYFQSYVKIISKGNDIEHCIICTNADFNYKDLQYNGITLDPVDKKDWPKLLDCSTDAKYQEVKKQQMCYKLEVSHDKLNNISCERKRNWIKNYTREDMEYFFKNCKDEMITGLFVNCPEVVDGKPFNDYTADEIKDFFNKFKDKQEKGSKTEICLKDFFQNCEETIVAGVFEGFLSCFKDFLQKLIFAVKMPNEDELDFILVKEVGECIGRSNAALPSAYIMDEMVNWFKKKDEQHHWLTELNAKQILQEKAGELMSMSERTTLSNDYQDKILKLDVLKFKDTVIDEMTTILEPFWNSSKKYIQFSSKTSKLTTVKIILAINQMTNFPNKDDYLVISSKRLRENKNELEKLLKTEKCHQLLIVVDEDAENSLEDVTSYENTIPTDIKKKIILISSTNFNNGSYEDVITYEHLHPDTMNKIREVNVSFKGSNLTLQDLIHESQIDKVLNSKLIENLLYKTENQTISIRSFNFSSFDPSLYIQRKLKFPLNDQLLNKLTEVMDKKVSKETMDLHRHKLMNDCKNELNTGKIYNIKEAIDIDSNGKINWLVKDDEQKKEILEKIEDLLEQNDPNDSYLLRDENQDVLIERSNKRIIITGVAGTGKSTILSYYYDEIKKKHEELTEKKPDQLVIKIRLMNYSKTLKQLTVSENNINDFFIKYVIGKSVFARSLLKHRLETSDRIIVMLDGFDEIDHNCQDKVIELVKTLNESIPLYITTRPHLADKLQLELSQLAYSLVKFTEEDQINYLTSLWEDFLTKEAITYHGKAIRTLATQLIDRIANTLNDKEKDFIGIPLQCRILAECFQSKIKDEIIQKPDEDHDLSHLIGEDQQFDLANLYKSLIDEKRRVFREEKIKFNSGESHIVNDSIEYSIEETERHLRKLAVKTIVNDQKDVDILIPSVGFQSESEKRNKEKQLNDFGIRFGLLDKKSDKKNEMQFLHRTYAEHLVAGYLFNGFLLDEQKHNKLLENESARKWIIDVMLVKNNYEGVRVFFDSMLKEIFNEEWRNGNQLNNLPGRLQQFASLLCSNRDEILPLYVAFEGRNGNIILFIFDCLDATFHETPSKIPSVFFRFNKLWSTFNQRTDVLDRFLNYFSNLSSKKLEMEFTAWLCAIILKEEQQIEKQNVERFLDFMDRHVNKIKLVYKNFGIVPLFIRSKFDELRQKFFKTFTSVYSNDSDLILFMKEAIIQCLENEDCQIVQIEKTLITLRDLGRMEVAAVLSRFVLIIKPELFKKEKYANIRLSFEELGMTELHRAALRGDLCSIEKEIDCSLDYPETCSEEEKKSVLQLMTNNKDMIPPFYVAATYGHGNICRKIFNFFDYEDITDRKEFVHRALKDAIIYDNVLMVQTILEYVKEIQDQNALVKLLQIVICDLTCYDLSKIIVETICGVVMQDQVNGYRSLNDLVFHDMKILKMITHVQGDILQGIIATAGGFDNWIKRLMDTDVKKGFFVLGSDGFLDKLNRSDQTSKLTNILVTKSPLNNTRPSPHGIRNRIGSCLGRKTKTRKPSSNSYWANYVKDSAFDEIKMFLKAISKSVCEYDLKRLLLYRDDDTIVILLLFLIMRGRDKFNDVLSVLPENLKIEIQDLSREQTPQLIDHFFSSSTFLESLDTAQQLNAIEFYLENGNQAQLSKFKKVVEVQLLEKAVKKLNSWEKEKNKKIAGLLNDKLDTRTVVNYNELIGKMFEEI